MQTKQLACDPKCVSSASWKPRVRSAPTQKASSFLMQRYQKISKKEISFIPLSYEKIYFNNFEAGLFRPH